MDFDFTSDPAPDAADDANSWLDDIGDFFASMGGEVIDFVTPDGLGDVLADGDVDLPTEAPGPAGDLANGGFYQSMPGIDSFVGSVLDQNAQLCADIDTFGKETFGEQAWAEAGAVAAADPYGMLDGIETPSDMWARFHEEDAQANADFENWRWGQERINDAESVLASGDQLIDEGEDLIYHTNTLMRYGY